MQRDHTQKKFCYDCGRGSQGICNYVDREYKPLTQECAGDQLHSFSPEPAVTAEKCYKATELEKSFLLSQFWFCLACLLGRHRGTTQMETSSVYPN